MLSHPARAVHVPGIAQPLSASHQVVIPDGLLRSIPEVIAQRPPLDECLDLLARPINAGTGYEISTE